MSTLADQFADLWATIQRREDELASLDDGEARRRDRREVEGMIGDPDAPNTLRAWVGDDLGRAVAAAQAIDAWFEPLVKYHRSRGELDDDHQDALDQYDEFGRFNDEASPVGVILRKPLWGRWSDPLCDLPPGHVAISDLFDSLLVVPETVGGTHADHPDVGRDLRLRFHRVQVGRVRRLPETGVKVGYAPIAQALHDLDLLEATLDGRPAYDSQVRQLDDRVRDVVRALAGAGVHVIALPEMTLHPRSLAALKSAIRDVAETSELVLVLGGTMRVAPPDGDPPYNEAIVLDHLGNEVARQRKLARWNLTARHCLDCGIPLPAGEDTRYEFITPGDETVVLEWPFLGRLATLVCEDLSRSGPGGWLRANFLLELQYTPVMDFALQPWRWAARKGGGAVRTGNCRIIVGNSLALTVRKNLTLPPADRVAYAGSALAMALVGGQARWQMATSPIIDQADALHTVIEWAPEGWEAYDYSE